MPEKESNADDLCKDKKISEIESLDPVKKESLTRILALSLDSDQEIRLRAIERFYEFPQADVYDRTIEALNDPDELVRIEALEYIGFWGNASDLETVLKFLDDGEELVRSTAVFAIGCIGDKSSIPILNQQIPGATDRSLADIYASIRRIDNDNQQALHNLLDMLSSSSYHARCSVANLLQDDLGIENDLPEIEARLKAARKTEKTVAAQSSIDAALERISNLKDEIK